MSLELKGRTEALHLPRVKEEECGSEPLLAVKKEDNIGLKQWTETLVGVDSGSVEVKEEPVELQLQQIKEDDSQSDSQQMIKIEEISPDEIKALEPKQVKEEEHELDFLQKVKMEANDTNQKENQNELKEETDTFILMVTDNEAEQPERNGNQFSKNIFKAEHHQDRKTLGASRSSRDEQHQEKVVKTRGRGDKRTKDKEINQSKICNICSTSFKLNQSLEAHMRTHTNEKPFSCVTCGKSFFSKNSFSRHKRTHSVQKLISCTMCSKGFHLKGNLNSHMRTHTGGFSI
ncbi:zinc finger protein 350-like isoform X3 [Gambusia affinis]|uniref:zinc finger protein 350-like isoform X3 n=1 Tax=Gambusia affinis TaxID=33528 RepID=UPI001CDC4770|nr:zinc finger protein 350-like isoform X3 [Gambusia affinis]